MLSRIFLIGAAVFWTAVPVSAAPRNVVDHCEVLARNGKQGPVAGHWCDLGKGYVAYKIVSLEFVKGFATGSLLAVEHCGQNWRMFTVENVEEEWGQVDKLLERVSKSTKPYPIARLRWRLAEIAGRMEIDSSPMSVESCACHFAYPELRGDRENWSGD